MEFNSQMVGLQQLDLMLFEFNIVEFVSGVSYRRVQNCDEYLLGLTTTLQIIAELNSRINCSLTSEFRLTRDENYN